MNLVVIRNYRSQVEQMLRMELAELEREVERLIAKRRALIDGADQDLRRFFTTAAGAVGANDAAFRYEAWEQQGEVARHIDDMIRQATTRRDLKQADMVAAAREAKKIDVLLTRQARRLRQAELRRDQLTLDEASARRYRHTDT
jgi:hypothetical protein